MRRIVLPLAAALLAAGAATVQAGVPLPAVATPCQAQAPVLLQPGAAPRAPLRIDLGKLASVREMQVEVERVDSLTRLGRGTPQPGSLTRRIAATYATRPVRGDGQLPYAGSFVVSYPGSTPKQAGGTFGEHGFFTALNGGAFGTTASGTGGTEITDRFPSEAVGVGATWRVVNCTPIYQTPARETRTYTLRSIDDGVIVATYRDRIAIDPAHVELGETELGGTKVALRVLTLQGTGTGSLSVPVANGLRQRQRTVSKVSVTLRTSHAGKVGPTLSSQITETRTQVPAG